MYAGEADSREVVADSKRGEFGMQRGGEGEREEN